MTIAEKLKLIQNISGLTQEKLAYKLKTSFATLNSWINGKSIPHKDKEILINNLFKRYSGEIDAQTDPLSSKKEIILDMSKKNKNILKEILTNPDIDQEFTLSLTYNSNSIEGSSLTKPETQDILFNNICLPNKTMSEQMEAKNHQTAWQYLLKKLSRETPSHSREVRNLITEDLILKLHSILMNSIRDDAGIYRNHAVRIVGSFIPTANYLKVPELMKALVKDINSKQKDIIKLCANIHSRFEQIHPFPDGNGRIGRLLLNIMLLKNNIPPAVIKQQKKRFYYQYLNKSQNTGDTQLMEGFLCDAIFEGYRILKRF